MAAAGHEIHDHTLHHDAAFWGDVANAPAWRDTIERSLDIFASMGLSTRGWNQPGGVGQGWSQQLRDTLALFYEYAAGRVGMEAYQGRNFHWNFLDDPFSLGRGGVFSWGYNLGTSQKQELENIITRIVDGMAQGLVVVPVFHNVFWPDTTALSSATKRLIGSPLNTRVGPDMDRRLPSLSFPDDSTAWALTQICTLAVNNNIAVLRLEDALYRVSHSHEFIDKWGEQITNPGFEADINSDQRPDGWIDAAYAPASVDSELADTRVAELTTNDGTYICGPEKGIETFQFSARAASTDNISVQVYRHELAISPDTVMFFYSTITNEWATYSYTFEVPENIDRLQIRFVNIGDVIFIANPSLRLTGTWSGWSHGPSKPGMTLWPNPATDVVNVGLIGRANRVRVYDVKGRFVGEFVSKSDRATWSVRDWPSGVYFAKMMTKDQVANTRKFVVIR
jgi:hypothetical protein